MIPWELLDTIPATAEYGELRLYRRGAEYSIRVDNYELMNSRMHSSEEALATLTCARLPEKSWILIGGLGMGYTIAAALMNLDTDAHVVVSELSSKVVEWNRGPLGELAGRPMDDPRVEIRVEDVARIIKEKSRAYNAILLDIDNGPETLSGGARNRLYSKTGLKEIKNALRPGGVFALWSSYSNPAFTRQLQGAGFDAEEVGIRAHGEKGKKHTIWIAQKSARV